jgi:alkaline phosphatase D
MVALGAAVLFALGAVVGGGYGLEPPAIADDMVKQPLTRLAFGSCARADLPQPFWRAIVESKPDVFVHAGDIVYGDCVNASCAPLDAAWAMLGNHSDFAIVRSAALPFLGMLDDHDNGQNDAVGHNPYRGYAKRAFLDFFSVPANDVWRTRGGLYRSRLFSGRANDARVRVTQLLLLDVRTFREPDWTPAATPGVGRERYEPDLSVRGLSASVLGDAQWAWLQGQLAVPADLRIVVSTIQVLPQGHGWERWGLFPHELARLLTALRSAAPAPSGGPSGTVLLSGDRHVGGFYKYTPTLVANAPRLEDLAPPPVGPNATGPWPAAAAVEVAGAAVYELTSSSLTHTNVCASRLCNTEDGPMLLKPLVHENNWGELAIDWKARKLVLALRAASEPARDGSNRRIGETIVEQVVTFDELHMQ